uniref:Solute carrier family 46 member 2 n=1 Tax=Acanthochromis polyacanthus TaxID=80966 RepID=A0A3Q1GEW4_9TELE
MSILLHAAFGLLRQLELLIMLEQLGSSLFDTALLMVVKDRCSNVTDPGMSREESQQKAFTDFYMTYNLIIRFVPILPALLLARLSDRGWRKTPVVVSLCGYLLSRVLLLLVVLFQLPLEVMFGAAVLFGLSGGFGAFWAGVMTLVSLGSTAKDRSKVMMRVELLYGAAGLVGSLVSGHLFQLGSGTVLVSVGTIMNLLSLLHSIFLLQVSGFQTLQRKSWVDLPGSLCVAEQRTDVKCECPSQLKPPPKINKVNVVLLFVAAFLYDFAVGGAVGILGAFVLKEPLSWTATQVGYGNAAGCGIFLTSFLGVIVFRRCASDVTLILIGMVSFASGIYFMAFVTTTSMFYLARSLNLFALIPLPTIRSLLSQQVPASLYGTALTGLQLILKFAGLAYIPAFTKIYQRTLDWFPGFVFILASIVTVLGMIPISLIKEMWGFLGNRQTNAKKLRSSL